MDRLRALVNTVMTFRVLTKYEEFLGQLFVAQKLYVVLCKTAYHVICDFVFMKFGSHDQYTLSITTPLPTLTLCGKM
jgi:hypothetical protein